MVQAYVVRGVDLSGQDAVWVLTAGMPATTSTHSFHPQQSDVLRYDDDDEMWGDDQPDGTAPIHHAGPRYISSRVSISSPPHSPSAGFSQDQQLQQQQSARPMHSRSVRFSASPHAAQGPGRSFADGPTGESTGRDIGGYSRSPIGRAMSKGMLSQQGSRALALQAQSSRALQGQRSGAAGLVRGQSRGLGSKERLWGAAEGSGSWPLRDPHGADQFPGTLSLSLGSPHWLGRWHSSHGPSGILM